MENKTYLREIRQAVADKAGIHEDLVGEFLNSLFSTISKGLERDQNVRVNGLGTFKTQWVDPRKSVNIATGEPVMLEGYNKIVFIPEVSLRERINAPYAKEEELTIDKAGNIEHPTFDPIARFGEQALEINELLSEINDLEPDVQNEQETTEQPVETEANSDTEATEPATKDVEPVAIEDEAVAKEDEPNEITEEPVSLTTEVIAEISETEPSEAEATETETTEVETTEAEATETETLIPAKKERKPFKPWLVALITLGIFCILLVGAYFFLRHQITSWAEGLLSDTNMFEQTTDQDQNTNSNDIAPVMDETEEQVTSEVEDANEIPTDEITEETKTPADDVTKEAQTTVGDVTETAVPVINETLAVETLREGSRLTQLARKHYKGNYHMWVYIYQANKDVIKNPDVIPVGKTIIIPRLDDKIIDINNTVEVAKADSIAKELTK